MSAAGVSKAGLREGGMSKGGKTVAFKVPAPRLASGADAWIASRGAEIGGPEAATHPAPVAPPAPPREKMARFTIDVPESLHRRIKAQCASRGIKMADMMRTLLEREFPEA